MNITRDQQIALDGALVAPANRLKIGKSNLRLSSDLNSKETTLQVVYDVLKLTPFYKAFQITADVPKIYMQEEMLQICPKLPNQQFKELPFEEAILTFLRDLENKNVKRSNEMYYPRFTKVIVNFFMTKDQSIPRRNKLYGAILPDELTNEVIKDSESYKEYYAIASGAEPPKTKASVKKKQVGSDMLKTPLTKGKRLKTYAKVAKTAKKKQLAKLKKSNDEEDDDEVGMNEDDEDNDDDGDDADDQDDDGQEYDEHDDEEQGDDDEHTYSDNDGDDFVHPKFSTHDEENKEEDSFYPRVQTPSHVESTDDEDSDEEIQDANVEGDKMNEEESNEEAEVDALYRDVNVNLEGRDSEMTDAPRTIVQTTQVIEDTHVIITLVNPKGQQQSSSVSSGFISNMLNPIPDTCIDSLFNLNTESTSLVDVPVTTFAEPPLLSATTLPPPPTPLITHLQQTPVSTPLTIPSSSLQDLPNFGSFFGFDHRLKTLENNFSEFNQTNQFAAAVSSIPWIVDAYLANKMHEAVKTAVHLQSKRLREEAQAENADFLKKLDDNIKKIIKDQVKEQVKAQVSKILPKIKKTVNEQLEAEVLTRSSNESKTFHVVAANLSELEFKKILIDKMESNKSIHKSDEQKNLYKALFKRRRDDEDKDEEPSAGSNWGSKRRRAGKEPESTSAPKEKTSKTTGKSTEGSKSHHKSAGESAQAEEPMHTAKDLEEPSHQEFEIGVTEDQPNEETFRHPDWFQKPAKPPTPDRDWNKTLPDAHGPTVAKLFGLDGRLRRQVISFDHLINNDLEYSKWCVYLAEKYTTSVTRPRHIKWMKMWSLTKYGSSAGCYDNTCTSGGNLYLVVKTTTSMVFTAKRNLFEMSTQKRWLHCCHNLLNGRNGTITSLLDWIMFIEMMTSCIKFKEGNFNSASPFKDIEDMLLLLVQAS
ncbi:hypothetical protein Tco_0993895 [Tanacetum coccineum]